MLHLGEFSPILPVRLRLVSSHARRIGTSTQRSKRDRELESNRDARHARRNGGTQYGRLHFSVLLLLNSDDVCLAISVDVAERPHWTWT